jgi:signal transduction histidine kinase
LSDGEEAPQEDVRTLVHDIRNLLAVIINYSELIAEETADEDAVKADIEEIRSAAERAIGLTEKLPRPPRADPQAGDPVSSS